MRVDRWVRGRWSSARRSALRCALLSPALLGSAIAARHARPLPLTTIPLRVILVANGVRDSMNMVFLHSTSGWRKYPPTSIRRTSDAARRSGARPCAVCAAKSPRTRCGSPAWEAPRGERAFAAAVTGECDDGDDAVGSWHTHPWRADSMQQPIKTRGLSVGDLRAFHASAGSDLAGAVGSRLDRRSRPGVQRIGAVSRSRCWSSSAPTSDSGPKRGFGRNALKSGSGK